jgi:hypothetical protein
MVIAARSFGKSGQRRFPEACGALDPIRVFAEITGTNNAQLAICPQIFPSKASPPTNSFWSNQTSTPAVRSASAMRFAAASCDA